MAVGEFKPGIGGSPLPGQKKKLHSVFPVGDGEAAPAWVAFDRKVLNFSGYFQENVHITKNDEQFRIRKVNVYFYLEDDSVQVNEPSIENSGIPQGTLINRHRVPLPPPDDNKFYTVEYFNVGNELQMYGRTFKLTDCDSFTANFLQKVGVTVGTPVEVPVDPHQVTRQKMVDAMQPLRPMERIDTLRQFLDHDRQVLRFGCYWDDRGIDDYGNEEGECREMILHYFLGDDTIEIRDVIRPNAGRDAVPVFVRRSKLPRQGHRLHQPGVETDRTVLNVCSSRHLLDSLKTGAFHEDYYTDADLQIGNVINVWGRPLKLVSCDDFTKFHYDSKFGLKKFDYLENKAAPKAKSYPPKIVPPYNGFGSEEDSLCSCAGLIPKPPQRDFKKFMESDRKGLISHVLRFVAVMDTDYSVDKSRRFIVSFYLSDDTIAVFEPPQRNSGVLGGKYLERGRVKLPGQEIFKSEFTKYYSASDFYVGAKPVFNDITFIIVGADEYALSYMEARPNEFPMSNLTKIVSKIKGKAADVDADSIRNSLTTYDNGNGAVPIALIKTVLSQFGLNEHEVLTITREYAQEDATKNDVEKTKALVQEKLRKDLFEDFVRLLEAFGYEDIDKCGKLSLVVVKRVCKAFKIPIPADRLDILLDHFTQDGTTDYEQFVASINWRENPTEPCNPEDMASHLREPIDIPAQYPVAYKFLLDNMQA
jgi:Ca2+-binding EF-hand superfamily protein